MLCWERFRHEPAVYRLSVLGTAPRVAVEAAVEQGWREWPGDITLVNPLVCA
jgi:transketolase